MLGILILLCPLFTIPVLDPRMPSDQSLVIAFDNSTNTIYFTAKKDLVGTIFRGPENCSPCYHFLDTMSVNQMVVMPSRALILLMFPFSIHAYRLTSSFDRM